MPSIRTRLTTTYALALTATLIAFGATLWVARGAAGDGELQRYVGDEARAVARLLTAARGPSALSLVETRDPLVGPLIARRAELLLDALPNFIFVTDTSGRMVYRSRDARFLAIDDAYALVRAGERLDTTRTFKMTVDRDTSPGMVGDYVRAARLARQENVLVLRIGADSSLAPVRSIIVAAPTRSSRAASRELLGAMIAIAPFVLLASIGTAYYIAGRSLQPLDVMVDAVEAITDGRSLHRRLPIGEAGDEFARLGGTLNAMIGRLETSFGGLRRFTADASHELKTPLTVLRANVERAMASPQGSGEQMVALEEALQEITRMADLVDSLLTLARFDEGRFDLHRVTVALEPLVREVFETAVILGEAAGLTVTLPVLDPVTVLGDRTRLRHLFLNLVTNAVKYTPPGGEVEVSLRAVEGTVAFVVRDTGIGIAAADLPYIFDRFWRADRARSRRAHGDRGAEQRGGFGLGLSIAQWITQAHGGTIGVVSRLTRGSTFTVILPIATPEELASGESEGYARVARPDDSVSNG